MTAVICQTLEYFLYIKILNISNFSQEPPLSLVLKYTPTLEVKCGIHVILSNHMYVPNCVCSIHFKWKLGGKCLNICSTLNNMVCIECFFFDHKTKNPYCYRYSYCPALFTRLCQTVSKYILKFDCNLFCLMWSILKY